jgi:outer membrane protein assembly factor BamB
MFDYKNSHRKFIITIILILACTYISCGLKNIKTDKAPDCSWTKFHYDEQNTGRSPCKGPEKPHIKWMFETGKSIYTPVTIGYDGTIYTGSDDGYLYAINPDGTSKWLFKAQDAVRSAPTIANDGTIYVGSRDCYLYAFDNDGKLKWKFMTGS